MADNRSGLVEPALQHLKSMQRLARIESRNADVKVTQEDRAHLHTPVLDLWLNLSRYEILFFNCPSDVGIHFVYRRAAKFSHRYRADATESEVDSFLQGVMYMHPEHFDLEQQEMFADEHFARSHVRTVMAVFLSERAFNRNITDISSLVTGQKLARHSGFQHKDEIIDKRMFNRMASVSLVTALENILRSAFFSFWEFWFYDAASATHNKEAMTSAVRKLGVENRFLLELWRNDDSTLRSGIQALKATLEGERNLLNFQMLDGRGGANWAYRHFFGVDIAKLPDIEKGYYGRLQELFKRRHHIVHGTHNETIRDRDIGAEKALVVNVAKQIVRHLWDLARKHHQGRGHAGAKPAPKQRSAKRAR